MCEDAQDDDYNLWVHHSKKKEGNQGNGDEREEGDDDGESEAGGANDYSLGETDVTDKVDNAGRDDIKEG